MLDPIKRCNDFCKRRFGYAFMAYRKIKLVNSLQNILTYPGVQEALDEGKIEVHAWYYIIETGEIMSMILKQKFYFNTG